LHLFAAEKFDIEVVIAFLFICFLVIVPLVIKVKICLKKYENVSDCDLEMGLHRSVSQLTLRVPENGGVE
jgi:hypothetical protein